MVRSRGQPESRDRGEGEREGGREGERCGKWWRMRNRTSRDNLIFSNFIRCASIKIQPPCRANTVTPLVPPFLPPPLPRHGATVHLHHLSSLLLDNILCSSTFYLHFEASDIPPRSPQNDDCFVGGNAEYRAVHDYDSRFVFVGKCERAFTSSLVNEQRTMHVYECTVSLS